MVRRQCADGEEERNGACGHLGRHGRHRGHRKLGSGEFGQAQYEEGRRRLTGEVNAAVRGAKAGGANDIMVIDCHGAGGSDSFRSLIPESLERGASYVLGHTWRRYVEPLKENCDAALLVGAHAMAGHPMM